VLRESSVTTRLRVVFNGSCRSSTGVSLNDCLHIGPKLQQDISDILLRWRLYEHVFCADITKMYRQIKLHPEDRRFQKILWSESGPPSEFELNTITYGLSCAPYLALRVLRQLAHDEESKYPLAAKIVLNDMYMDDVLSGADTLTLARTKASQIDKLLMAGGFQLQKWTSKSPSIVSDIDSCRHSNLSARHLTSESFERTLGLAWHPEADNFVMQPRPSVSSSTVTKQSVLSRIAVLRSAWLDRACHNCSQDCYSNIMETHSRLG
jgi:hypothetical protein